MAILFALAAAIGWGSSDYAAGKASRRSSAISVVILTHLVSTIALVVIAVLPGQTGSPGPGDLAWGLAAGLGGGAGAMLLFRGLAAGSMSVVAPITAAGAATVPAVAGLVQGESLGVLGIAGIGLALVAVVLVSLGAADDDGDEGTEAGGVADAELRVASPTGAPTRSPSTPRQDLRLRRSSDLAPERIDATISAFEREFGEPVVEDGVAATTTARRWATPWGPPSGPVVHRTAPGSPSLRDLAVEMHRRRVEFDLARRGQPVAIPPVEPEPAADSDPTTRRSSRGVAGRLIARPGVVDAMFSGIGFGLFFVLIARASEDAGHWPLVSARFVSAFLFAGLAILTSTAVLPDRSSRPAVVVAGLLDAVAAVFFVLSTHAGLLAVGAVLASLYPAATVLLARFVDDERITRQQMAGLVVAGVAVSLLAL